MIEFALKKLATPESQRRIHSSLMAKTLSAIVSGASFLPTLAGSNAAVQTSAFSAGRLAQSLINRKNIPTETPLTDTELIELAGLVEDLQDTIISTYYNYKNALNAIKSSLLTQKVCLTVFTNSFMLSPLFRIANPVF